MKRKKRPASQSEAMMTHNYPGLTDTLKRLGINEVSEVNAIQAVGLWKKGNDGVAADCQHLLE